MSAGTPLDIYEPVIWALKAQIEEWQKMVERLEWMRANGTVGGAPVLATAQPAVSKNGGPVFSNDSFFGLTIAEAAKKYLGAIKKTASVRAISDALIAGGLKSAAKNPVENVRSTLSRMPAFVLINGEFGLAEWYPGRKAVLKQRSPSQQATTAGEQSEEDDGAPLTVPVD